MGHLSYSTIMSLCFNILRFYGSIRAKSAMPAEAPRPRVVGAVPRLTQLELWRAAQQIADQAAMLQERVLGIRAPQNN